MKITPTVGRLLHYHPNQADAYGHARRGQPLAAVVAHVNDDGSINISALSAEGSWFGRLRVPIVQEGEDVSPLAIAYGYCTWMPYQVGQAAKTEQLEKQLNAEPRFPIHGLG
jgi:hypothetical protein